MRVRVDAADAVVAEIAEDDASGRGNDDAERFGYRGIGSGGALLRATGLTVAGKGFDSGVSAHLPRSAKGNRRRGRHQPVSQRNESAKIAPPCARLCPPSPNTNFDS